MLTEKTRVVRLRIRGNFGASATLSDGCICFSRLGNSLQEGIDALLLARAERRLGPLRRIILETSGLAEPGPIVRSLRQVREMDFHLGLVATFDAARSTQGDDFLPHYAAQLAAAQTIVLTKLDTLPPEEWQARANEARRFNPLAARVVFISGEERARAAFAGHNGRETTPRFAVQGQRALTVAHYNSLRALEPGRLLARRSVNGSRTSRAVSVHAYCA